MKPDLPYHHRDLDAKKYVQVIHLIHFFLIISAVQHSLIYSRKLSHARNTEKLKYGVFGLYWRP